METLKIVKTAKEFDEMVAYIKANDFIAFDTETNGINKDSLIIGFSVSADDKTGYYVTTLYWCPVLKKLEQSFLYEFAKEAIEALQNKKLIMHNAIFDCQMVKNNYSIDLMPYLHTDTMILAQIVNENISAGLKERATYYFGEDSKTEQDAVKKSVIERGGQLTKANYELYKADADLLALYGAKDTLLTMKVFYALIEDLYAEGMESFFYDDESMPLLRGPTYDLNTTGLKVDPARLQSLRATLEAECMEARAFIYKEIEPHVKDKYPGTNPKNTFNINGGTQLAWLLFDQLGQEFNTLTKNGKELCKALELKLPYAYKDKAAFIHTVSKLKGQVWEQSKYNYKTKKMGRPKKIGDWWTYTQVGKETLQKYSDKYAWVKKLLEFKKNDKLLNTYVIGIQEQMQYSIIRPSFLQHGTTSGRYSSKQPNFQNLPRDDKRIKNCIISRPGKIFVGADYSQLEPRVFASVSGDEKLLASLNSSEDFYSTIGIEIFGKYECVPLKEGHEKAFGVKYKKLRDIAKVVALSTTYGTTAPKMATSTGKTREEAQEIIDLYFERFPAVKNMMLAAHNKAKTVGYVTSLFGRKRRIPEAMQLAKTAKHSELTYELRKLLNLAVNHEIQSTGASVMNRSAINIHNAIQHLAKTDKLWADVKLVLQVHDELILEGPEALKNDMEKLLKEGMENTVSLPGIRLEAIPKSGYSLAELK